ncbi:MAG: hypothetical protein R3B45_13900 [Bdellovibrionota bacterium]
MKNKLLVKFIYLPLICNVFLGCKAGRNSSPTKKSQLRSLQNMMYAKPMIRNHCGKSAASSNSNLADYRQVFDLEKELETSLVIPKGFNRTDIKRTMNDVLSAIPQPFLMDFFLFHKGKIKIVNLETAAPSFCKFEKQTEKSQNVILACWNLLEKVQNHTDYERIPVIYLHQGGDKKKSSNAWSLKEIIYHSLIREFGFVMAQYLTFFDHVPPEKRDESVTQKITLVPRPAKSLAEGVFYEELYKAFVKDIGEKVDSVRKLNIQNGKKDKGIMLFAESFDSFYCNDKTKKDFEVDFPESYEVFSKMFNQQLSSNERKDTSVSREERNEKSLSLVGSNIYNPNMNVLQQRYVGNTNYLECQATNQKGGANYNIDVQKQAYPLGGAGAVAVNSPEYQMVMRSGLNNSLGYCQTAYLNRDYYQYPSGGLYRYGLGVNGYVGMTSNLFAMAANIGMTYLIQKNAYRPRIPAKKYINPDVNFTVDYSCGVQKGGGLIQPASAYSYQGVEEPYDGSSYDNVLAQNPNFGNPYGNCTDIGAQFLTAENQSTLENEEQQEQAVVDDNNDVGSDNNQNDSDEVTVDQSATDDTEQENMKKPSAQKKKSNSSCGVTSQGQEDNFYSNETLLLLALVFITPLFNSVLYIFKKVQY